MHPQSPFNAAVQIVSTLLLLYSVFLVPVQLSFWDNPDPCVVYPSLYFDMFADAFFVCELFYNFFVGIADANDNYIDTLPDVAYIQLTSPWLFWFNMATSVPVSWIDWHVANLCQDYGSAGTSSGWHSVQLLRAIKTVRLLKLLRLLRATQVYGAVTDVMDLNPVYPRVFKILFALVLALHFSACLVWRVKEDDPPVLSAWLAEHGIAAGDTATAYVICAYFVVTVYTTVGLGDIHALDQNERVLFVFLMLTAAFLFGILISELQEVFVSLNKGARQLDEYIDGITAFLRRNRVSHSLHRRFRRFVRFKYSFDRSHDRVEEILAILPLNLRNRLASALNDGVFSAVPLFRKIRSETDRAYFAAALLPRVRSATLPTRTLLAHHREVADRLIVITAGRVAMHLPLELHDEAEEKDWLRVLHPGDGFGDLSVLGDPRWAGAYGVHADFVSIEDVHLTYISTADVLDVLNGPLFAPIRAYFDSPGRAVRAPGDPPPEHRPPPVADMRPAEIRATYRWSLLVQIHLQRPTLRSASSALTDLARSRGPPAFAFPKDSLVLFPLTAQRPSMELDGAAAAAARAGDGDGAGEAQGVGDGGEGAMTGAHGEALARRPEAPSGPL